MSLLRFAKRIVHFYLSPSGLLLAVALSLIGVGVATDLWGITVAGVGVLALFFPYRFLREQQRTDARIHQLGTSVSSTTYRLREDVELARHGLELSNSRLDYTAETAFRLRQWREQRSAAYDRAADVADLTLGKGYLPFNRQIIPDAVRSILDYWSPRLGIEVAESQIRYAERKIVFIEGQCSGRVATTSTDIVIRSLAARSLARRDERLEIAEIGTLFGLGAFMLYEATAPLVSRCRLTLIDPLEGYYGNDRPDPATGVRVTEAVLLANRDRLAIPADDVVLLKGYSTDPAIAARATGPFDLLVIDGDHTYDGIRQDYEGYAATVRPGGLLIVDDYWSKSWPDVTKYTNEVIANDPRFELVGTQSRTAVFRRVESDGTDATEQPAEVQTSES